MGVLKDLKTLENYKPQCSWLNTYGFVSSLIQQTKALRVAEVGVAYGYHAEHLLETNPDITYVGLDPYKAGYDPEDSLAQDVESLFGGETESSMDRLFRVVQCKLAALYLGRATVFRLSGDLAGQWFAPQSFDLAYIDGDHTYEGVLKDLEVWYPLIKKGKVLCGDDYDWPGVRKAIQEFFKNKNIQVNSPIDQKWYVYVE
jgi:predicted O-methyltransferase YrrM